MCTKISLVHTIQAWSHSTHMTLLICSDAATTCREKHSNVKLPLQNIHVTAYSPLGTPPSSTMFKDYQPPLVMNDPVVKEIAKKYNKNVGQVQLAAEAFLSAY